VYVSGSKIQTLKTIFTSEYWLIVSLCGAFFTFFALNRGGVVVFIEASFCLLVINLIAGEYRLRKIPLRYWATIAISGYLMLQSVIFHPDISHYRWMANLVRMLCVVLAIHCLVQKRFKDWVKILLIVVFCSAVYWQLCTYYILNMQFGTFSNPHIISNFTMLAFPLIIYFIWITPKWYKLIFIPIGILDADFIIRTGSRPAIIAITLAAFFASFFLTRGRKRWIGVLLICTFFAVLYSTHYAGLADRLGTLVVDLPTEDRIQIWSATSDMLKDNSIQAWIVGNGIGSFRKVFKAYAPPEEMNEIFPHSFFFEILYQSGLIGVTLVAAGLILLFFAAFRSLQNTSNKRINLLIKFLVVTLISWLIHSGLTLPIYSKYSIYCLAFILGTLLAILDKNAHQKNYVLTAGDVSNKEKRDDSN